MHGDCRQPTGLCSRNTLTATCLHFSPTDMRSTQQKAAIRVSCLVIRENHGWGPSSLQKKCLTAGEPERLSFVTRGEKEAIWQVRLRASFSSVRLAPRPDGPLSYFASPLGKKAGQQLRPQTRTANPGVDIRNLVRSPFHRRTRAARMTLTVPADRTPDRLPTRSAEPPCERRARCPACFLPRWSRP